MDYYHYLYLNSLYSKLYKYYRMCMIITKTCHICKGKENWLSLRSNK